MISEHFIAPLDFAAVISRVSRDIDRSGEDSLIALAAMLIFNQYDLNKILVITEALFGQDAARQIRRVIVDQAGQPEGPWHWKDQDEGTFALKPDRLLDLMAPDRDKMESTPPSDRRPVADIIP